MSISQTVETADGNNFICTKLPSNHCSNRNQKSKGVASCFMVFLMALVLFSIVALLLPTKFNKKISFVLEGNIYYRATPFFKKKNTPKQNHRHPLSQLSLLFFNLLSL